jgi:hypothetical protein
MRAPNTERRDVARVSSITGRSGNISRSRLMVEEFVQARRLQPCSITQAAQALQIDLKSTSKIMQRMVADGLAVKVDTNGAQALYVWHTQAAKYRAKAGQPEQRSSAKPIQTEPPIRNSNQPNGTQEYWREHMRQLMAPARAELQA